MGKDLIDLIADGFHSTVKVKAQEHTKRRTEAIEYVGGEEDLNSMLTWASQNYDATKAAELDKAMKTSYWDAALNKVAADRKEATGIATGVLSGSGKGGAIKVEGFGDGISGMMEMGKAFADPRYGTDQTYTNMVDARNK